MFSFSFFCFVLFLEIGSLAAQASLRLTVYLRMTLNFRSSCLYPPSTGVSFYLCGMHARRLHNQLSHIPSPGGFFFSSSKLLVERPTHPHSFSFPPTFRPPKAAPMTGGKHLAQKPVDYRQVSFLPGCRAEKKQDLVPSVTPDSLRYWLCG